MGTYKTKGFSRWARKEKLTDASLCAAVEEMAKGLIDADLGGGVVKKRVARQGKGKSGGYRTLLATNKDDRWVFMFGFAKSARSNIDQREAEVLRLWATQYLGFSAEQIATAIKAKELIEVKCDEEKEKVSDPRGRS